MPAFRRALIRLIDAAGALGAFCVFCIFVLMVLAGVGRQLNLQVSGVYLPVSPHETRRRAQADITRWIGTGERILSVAGRFPLEDCAGAHELVESGGKVGTVVVEP